jgi:hypothetical protein
LSVKRCIAAVAVIAAFSGMARAQDSPRLLLTPQRLRRLQRDRARQTVRWQNFEAQIQSGPDSPQRGFELALYYAVTHDEKRGREAIQWALAHACGQQQLDLIVSWCADLISNEERLRFESPTCRTNSGARIFAFRSLQDGSFREAQKLYAACEYLVIYQSQQHSNPPQATPQFFSQLPIEFLLSLRPEQVEHPDWMTHIAALALVAVDPNLEASQYVQGWAIEDRQMIREGPGVGYEFLWADPYLPGVGYQNLEPWIYDEKGRLFARTNWDPQSCWIAISTRGIEEEHCPKGWREKPATFGHLILLPMTARCEELPELTPKDTALLWRLSPGATVSYHDEKQHSGRADAAGIFRLPLGAEGKVCVAR